MKNIFLVLAAVFMWHLLNAQKKQRLVFNSYNSVGFVAGKLPVTFAAQTQNGIVYKNWFVGGGFGIDNYYVRTLPLFGTVKKIIHLNGNSFFLYASIGSNIIAKNKERKTGYSTIYKKGGVYADAGAGYLIKVGKKSHLFFCIGNTVKKIKEVEEFSDYLGMPGVYDGRLKFSRIALQAGFQF